MTAAERNLGLPWVVAVVAGWVIGFWLCGAIQEFLSTFFIDGLVIGSAVGIAQGLVLRRQHIAPFVPWVALSIIGFGIGKFVSDIIGQASTNPAAIMLGGAVIGLLVGLTQSVVLMDRFARAWWWIGANVLAWAVGWSMIGLADPSSVAMTYAVGAIGAAAVGIITGIALIGLSRHRVAKLDPQS